MFCKHKWELISETTTKSQLEHANDIVASIKNAPLYMLDRKHIQVFRCEKCGKIKRYVTDI